MKLLAIETCFSKCSVCFYNGENFYNIIEHEKNQHRECLPQMVQTLMANYNFSIENLDAIIVNHGPGTFTGIRIGIAFAQGIAIAFNIPVYGICTTEAIVQNIAHSTQGVAVKAIGNYCYYQEFLENGRAISGVEYIDIALIPENRTIIAVGLPPLKNYKILEDTPNAQDLVKRFLFIKPPLYVEPMYVRTSGIQPPSHVIEIK